MKLRLITVVFLMVTLITSLWAQSEDDFNVTLTADGTGVLITKFIGKTEGVVRIPATIQGMPVRELGSQSFTDRNYVNFSVVIPNGVTKIGEQAFYGNMNLEAVTLPNSIVEIEERAFEGTALTSVTLPTSLAVVEYRAFGNIESLKTVTIPNGVKTIGEAMFAGCSALTAITIPNSVTSIANSAFARTGITSIDWPANIKTIESGMFGGSQLRSIVIPEGITRIGGEAFRNCPNLTSVTLPSTIEWMGFFAFAGCESLTTVDIPQSVTQVQLDQFEGGFQFNGCPRLNLASQAAIRRIGYTDRFN